MARSALPAIVATLWSLVVWSLLVWSLLVWAQPAEATVVRTVRVTGQAAVVAGDVADAARTARRAALREAVESGVGVLISSTTRTSNYAVIEDRVFSTTQGYVSSYDVITEGLSDDELSYGVTIDARVDLQQLEQDLSAVGLAHAAAGRPRYLCRGIVRTAAGHRRWSAHLSEGLREALGDLATQLEPVVIGSESMDHSDDELARDYLADVLIDARATVEARDPVVPGAGERLSVAGVVSRMATVTFDIRWLDESRAVHRWSLTAAGAGVSPDVARERALTRAVETAAATVRQKVTEDLRRRAYDDRQIQLIVDGGSDALDRLERRWDGTLSSPLVPRGRSAGQARYDTRFTGSGFELSRRLSAAPPDSVDVDVVQVSANRLRLRLLTAAGP